MIKENIKSFFTVWGVLIVLNQLFIFGGCFAPYCIIAALPHTGIIAFFITLYITKEERKEKERKTFEDKKRKRRRVPEPAKHRVETLEKTKKAEDKVKESPQKEIDPLKEKGDRYEKFIGKRFEEKGELVIYNGFIHGYKDEGVDIISISLKSKSINLIQCKNWTKKPMMMDDIKNIYEKLDSYNIGHITRDSNLISNYLQIKKSSDDIRLILQDIDRYNYTVRKTLYVGSDKVMDLNIGKHIKLIQTNIFRYRDMKIVIKEEK